MKTKWNQRASSRRNRTVTRVGTEQLENRQLLAVNLINSDLEFMLQQILIAEAHANGADIHTLVPNVELARGLRTVTGEFNNLVTSQSNFGAADVIFPRMLPAVFGPGEAGTSYAQVAGTVIDSRPRTISNLIVDQTPNNPAAQAIAAELGLELVTGTRADGVTQFQTYVIPNETPDGGLSAPFNSWMTFFGQFFDHGLDLVPKGGSGTVFIPLQTDDPLYVPGSQTNFMLLTRATNLPGLDGVVGTADDIHEQTNLTSPFVDQNQTYTSHPSHQVFLRQYELVAGRPVATGKLIESPGGGGMATWLDVKEQAHHLLGINLTDADVNNLPLLATDDYGKFLLGPNGFPQLVTLTGMVEGNPAANGGNGVNIPANTARTGHAFLDDIAHTAAPRNSAGIMLTPDADNVVSPSVAAGQYDNELLNAHYIAGDGRVNENIALTAVHHVFHSEHNRLVGHIKDVIGATAIGGDLTFLNQWLRTPLTPNQLQAVVDSETPNIDWNGERLFQAAKFGTEMQYQHLVFEEFGRTIQPNIDAFLDFDSGINPAIVAEFAHTVYRFGHSMLTETIDRLSPTFASSEIGLIQAFLNPLEFAASGVSPAAAAGAIIRGVTRQVGNEIDEFVTEALRNNLVGLPLDLPAINIARGRDTGIPSLNAARREFFEKTGDSQLAPYTSWADFAGHIKHPESLVNFVAAYGTHPTVAAASTLAAKRTAASLLVLGDGGVDEPTDRLDFMNSTGTTWSSFPSGVTKTGLDDVDFWVGGLAEANMPFGGMLGSTFNFVFETQLEALQNGDRFYYLHRLAGLNFLSELENNSFAKIIMANTDVRHLPGVVFTTPGLILEVDQSFQNGPDPAVDVIRDNPATPGTDTNYLRYTGDQHIVLGGTDLNDVLIASEGDDTLWGGAGNDRLEGGFGNDEILGGAGDDIITDMGGDDVLKGEDGNDVIQGGNGINLILSGPGHDFIITGEDESEVFAGPGNDFILGAPINVQMAGNEGHDWIEIGTQDGAPGDNFDPLGLDGITGHDVFVGTGQFDELIGEGGDDIVVGSGGPDKLKLMSGFDWVTFKNETAGVNADFYRNLLFEAPLNSGGGVGSRFFQVEGLSGSPSGDILRGDDETALTIPQAGARGSVLTTEGIALIDGLGLFLGTAVTSFSAGNIIFGGGGSDIIEGRGGDDLIDGDRWLNVRIGITGQPNRVVNSAIELIPEMLSGAINPGQLFIIREILTATGGFDTAMFSGPRANYTVTNVNGVVTVTDNVGTDGTDRLTNMERMIFGDGVIVAIAGANLNPVNQPTISDTTPATGQLLQASIAGVTDGNNPGGGAVTGPVTYVWQFERVPASGIFQDISVGLAPRGAAIAFGATFRVTPNLEGFRLRVKAHYQDATNVLETVYSAPTTAVAVGTAAPALPPLLTGEQPGVVSTGIHFLGSDLQFILDQIIIAERHAAGENLTDILPNIRVPDGLRTVTGEFNNLLTSQSDFGAAHVVFPRMLPADFRNDQDGDTIFGIANTNYGITGNVADADPRLISNLIVDQTASNAAAYEIAYEAGADGEFAYGATAGPDGLLGTGDDVGDDVLRPGVKIVNGLRADGITPFQTFEFANESPDVGLSAPFNSWMTFFGQFFDHGLDLVTKGGSGTVYIPLQVDDPLYVQGSPTNFMVLTRATILPGNDGVLGTADDVRESINQTSPFVDQNQTYTSHPSHQVFLRAYELNIDGKPVSTGRLIENPTAGGMATWADIKAQARELLGISLVDTDILRVPLLATDDYGHFERGPNGFPMLVTPSGLVEGNPAAPVLASLAMPTGHAFLDDIAHNAVPVTNNGSPLSPDGNETAGGPVASGQYDDELLNAHYIAGDGRVNENIGLTAVHHVFHSEHNRLVDHIKDVIGATAIEGDFTFLNEWLLTDYDGSLTQAVVDSDTPGLNWNGERLFQAAKFGTEMQYQHLVFEEFARSISPGIDVFIPRFQNYDTSINPAIVAEFAHTVYRFGHSMLTETIDRLDANFNSSEIGLIQAFLNPLEFNPNGLLTAEEAAGAIVRGVTRQVGNAIDEFVTEALRNNLVGLPLDLPAINIARGRDTGIPSLNAARREFHRGTGDSQLAPYTSWADFAANITHPESLINFVAAYGTHTTVTSATSLQAKRDAATLLVLGGTGEPEDRLDFLNSTGAHASFPNGVTKTGLDDVDFWVGGLAEAIMPFGGMLGSTFNFVFETQLESLQNGDRFYYLERTGGLNFLAELENNTFAKMIMANTDVKHLPMGVFTAPGHILEVDPTQQQGGLGADPAGDVIRDVLANFLQYTGPEHVVLGGTDGNDVLIASEGDDTLWGDAGNDRLEGGFGNDEFNGGPGDDIITDMGGDDVIRGESGNDVIHGGNGINLIIGGFGKDFIVTGEDASEAFGGPGDDFILGSDNNEQDVGGEGHDWLEGGLLDGAPGENFNTFGDDRIIGNDVFVGSGLADIMIGEGGDDIMVGSTGGVNFNGDKYLGASGYDWVTFKDDPMGVDVDLGLVVLDAAPIPAAGAILSRFRQVEGLSGSPVSDFLRGDDADSLTLPFAGNQGSILTNIGLIDGLADFLGAGVTSFGGGNIILGGGGSDMIEGRGGDDLIDGDLYLNVRISVRANLDGTGPEIASYDSMVPLVPLMLNRTYNPGQLVIVRELLLGEPGYDTAVYAGLMGDYQIDIIDGGDLFDPADDTLIVTDLANGWVHRLTNIERIQFNDASFVNDYFNNADPEGLLTVSDTTPRILQTLTVSSAGVIDFDNITLENPNGDLTGPVALFWQVETAPGSGVFQDIQQATGVGIVRATGSTFTVTEDLLGLALRVRGVYQDGFGTLETVFSAPTQPVNDDFTTPTVTINQAATQADPTNLSTIEFTAIFSEAVTGFDAADVTLGGAANPTTAVVTTTDNITYTITLSGMTADGTVLATLAAGAAEDAGGNLSAVSSSTDNSVLYDATAPVVVATNLSVNLTDTSGAIVNLTSAVTATDAASGLASLVLSPPSGSHFPVGTTIVTYTATDVVGNVRTGNFTVTVNPVGVIEGQLFVAGSAGPEAFVIIATNPAAAIVRINGLAVPGSPFNLTGAVTVLNVFGNGGDDTFTLSGVGQVNLTGGAGNNSFTVSGFSGTGSITGGGGTDTVIATKNVANINLSDSVLATSDGMSLGLTGVSAATLTGGGLANAFNLTGWTGSATAAGAGAVDTLTYSRDADFALTNTSLAIAPVAGNSRIWTLSALEAVNLTGHDSANTFNVSGWTGTGTLSGGGGTDTVSATRNANFVLDDASLRIGTPILNLSSIETAHLTGTAGNNNFTVSGWSGGGSLTGGGGTDRVLATKDTASLTLSDAALSSSDGMTLSLTGIPATTLTGGASANAFNLSGWTGIAALAGGGNSDTLSYQRDASFTLTNTSLAIAPVAPGIARTWTLNGIETAHLTGGTSNNNFTVSGWTGIGSLAGGGGTDRVLATKNDASINLNNSALTSGAMNMALSGITAATLTGGAGNNEFNMTDWTGSAIVNGAGGVDTLSLTEDASFTLTNTSLAVTPVAGPARTWTLSALEAVNLTGGASNNTFNVSGRTIAGLNSLTGGGGNDTIAATRNANFVLADSALAIGTSTFNLSGIKNAELTGGASNNTFTASGWTGTGTLAGGGGTDTVIAVKENADLTLTNTSLTGSDGLILTLSSVERSTLTLDNNSASHVIDASGFTGISTLTATGTGRAKLIGGAANDILTVAGNGDAVLVGMGGNDTLRANGNGRTVLIGGAGADNLATNGGSAGTGQAILIGGSTIYDLDPTALDLILDEWGSANTFNDRITRLTDGTGLNGPIVLSATTVLDDLIRNTLTNSAPPLPASPEAQAWFLVRARDLRNKRGTDAETILP